MFKNLLKLSIISFMFLAGSVQAQLNFAPKVDYSTGNYPSGIALADVNGDGFLDMITANANESNISVLTGTGLGTFGTAVSYPANYGGVGIVVGDLNNDNKPDIAIVGSGTTITVLTNTGAGFAAPRYYTTGDNPTGIGSIAMGDLNGDGFADLAVTSWTNGNVSVLTNTGTGSFGAKTDYVTGADAHAVAIGDLNGDGKLDLAVANFSSTLSILTNSGTSFGAAVNYPTGANPSSVAIGDFNDDGKPDVAVANIGQGNISVFTNLGNGIFGTSNDYNAGGGGVYSLISADLNGDDRLDLSVVNFSGKTVSVLTNSGTSFGPLKTFATANNNGSSGPISVAFGDGNGDGKLDLAVANRQENSVSVFINTSTLPSPFITTWDLAKLNPSSTEIYFEIASSGYVRYSWETMPLATASGVGTISGGGAVISGLPLGEKIRLHIKPTNLQAFSLSQDNFTVTPDLLVGIESWGDVKWTSFYNSFNSCNNLTITATNMPNLTSVTGMSNMFNGCTSLKNIPNIENWNTSNVTDMSYMFFNVPFFNQSIGGWNTSNVTNMTRMFAYAYNFNQPIGNWNTAKVTDMSSMFFSAFAFNQSIGGWNTSAVTDMNRMFVSVAGFNQPIGNWNTANVTNMNNMFQNATAFNQSISGWNTANVTDMDYMFKNATAFNQSIGGWNVPKLENTQGMFAGATSFNQPLGNWNNRIIYDFRNMFDGATAFNQNLGAWGSKISVDSELERIFDNSGLSVANYSATLKGFSVTTATGRTLGALGLKYCSNSAARNTLTSTGLGGKSWNIVGDMVSTVPSTIIVTQPISQIIQPSTTANLSISATGDNLMYLWSSNETVSAISSKPAGIYTVTVSGTCGSVVSNAATIVGLSISSASVTGISTNGNVVSITSPVTITINGTGFAQGVTVTVNGVALSVVSVSPTSILVNLPSGVITTNSVNVQITNPNQVASVSVVPVNVSPTSINLPTYQSTSFSVYPNPVVNGEWRIENAEVGATMLVFNAQGSVVYTQTLVSETTLINAHLTSGIYLVKVGKQMVKLVLE